ncbi:MAG: CoA-acylating methylmalonate-semialdehyde dehydrogenase [candidate division Zixibacteria bacterium]|nr:CoA-acylating methylmalonate-semialdehyde dehydrogenase [candidate division Zixibacteria bacterium]
MMDIKNLINGEWCVQSGKETFDIINPCDGQTVEGSFKNSTNDDVDAAVAAAKKAFKTWSQLPVAKRCRILFHCKELLENNLERIAEYLVKENGKTMAEAEGELRRGIEVVEFAAGMPSLMKGDIVEGIAANVDGLIIREPLGVVTGACPFNFPAMIPLWMFPVAIACGNTFVLKPSEKCPISATMIAEIFRQGGLPEGVLNVVQGGGETFKALVSHEDVQAVSFVGSTPVAKSVWHSGTTLNKRVQSLGGAKNHIIIMPDADSEQTVKAIIGSSFGCAGARCMASSVLVLVGDADKLLDDIIQAAKNIKLGNGLDVNTQMGPVISAAHKKRVEDYIQIGFNEGAEVLLDGRGVTVKGYEKGSFVGPTLLGKVTSEMRVAKEEIFGPVLSVMRCDTLQQAIDIANTSEFGNGASIFTDSGSSARQFRVGIQVGMVGINVGVPAPMAFFSFGGRKNSLFGDLRAFGPDAVEFYTMKKTVVERWFGNVKTGSIWSK